MQVYFEFISVTSFSVAPSEWFQLPFWQVVGERIPRFNTFCINQACDSRNANYLHCNLPLWFLSSFQIPVGVIGVTECSQGRGHVTARWLALACVSGNSWDYENTCSVSPSKSFSTCVRYIICCWLWASCHLPPIKTPLCNSAPFSQRTRSWQNTVQHTPLTAFTHFHPSWGLSVGSADTGSAVGRTTPRFQASVEVRLWAAVFSRTWKFFHSYRAKKNKKWKACKFNLSDVTKPIPFWFSSLELCIVQTLWSNWSPVN